MNSLVLRRVIPREPAEQDKREAQSEALRACNLREKVREASDPKFGGQHAKARWLIIDRQRELERPFSTCPQAVEHQEQATHSRAVEFILPLKIFEDLQYTGV